LIVSINGAVGTGNLLSLATGVVCEAQADSASGEVEGGGV